MISYYYQKWSSATIRVIQDLLKALSILSNKTDRISTKEKTWHHTRNQKGRISRGDQLVYSLKLFEDITKNKKVIK